MNPARFSTTPIQEFNVFIYNSLFNPSVKPLHGRLATYKYIHTVHGVNNQLPFFCRCVIAFEAVYGFLPKCISRLVSLLKHDILTERWASQLSKTFLIPSALFPSSAYHPTVSDRQVVFSKGRGNKKKKTYEDYKKRRKKMQRHSPSLSLCCDCKYDFIFHHQAVRATTTERTLSATGLH